MNNYFLRTFRVYDLKSETETSYNISAENGYDEWRFSTAIVSAIREDNSYYITTISGSEYRLLRYEETEIFKTVDKYMELNGFTEKRILTEQEFKEKYNVD